MEKRILDMECFYGFTELLLRGEFAEEEELQIWHRRRRVGALPKSTASSFGSQREAPGTLESVCQLQDAAFAEMPPEDLHAHGQAGFRPAARDRDARNARQ